MYTSSIVPLVALFLVAVCVEAQVVTVPCTPSCTPPPSCCKPACGCCCGRAPVGGFCGSAGFGGCFGSGSGGAYPGGGTPSRPQLPAGPCMIIKKKAAKMTANKVATQVGDISDVQLSKGCSCDGGWDSVDSSKGCPVCCPPCVEPCADPCADPCPCPCPCPY